MLISAQRPVPVGAGSYASFAPLTESRSTNHDGCQAYQTEHRRLFLPDSLLARLAPTDGSREGSLALPTNDWWTYALVNKWTGKLWFYPGWAEATEEGVQIGYPDHWEPTGCEVKWDTPLSITFTNAATGKKSLFQEALVDAWSDFMMSFILQDGQSWVRVTCMHGSPLVWLEANGITMKVTNPDEAKYAVFQQTGTLDQLTIGLLTEGLTAENMQKYAFRIPRKTTVSYAYDANTSSLTTTFHIDQSVLMGFLPHHYYETTFSFPLSSLHYLTPRGQMRLAEGNDFTFTYRVHAMLPFFPAPLEWKEGFSTARMQELMADYAQKGSFGADTYWGGKGLTQMMHYMTFALQTGDAEAYLLAKKRLKQILIDWYTFTPGEPNKYFARFPRFGALIGFDPSYDSDTFNDHHFHYGYFVYASAVLCLLDEDFRTNYGEMVREVARDYANWQRSADEPWFRTLDPYCGHSFAGGLGNAGNGNGQESSSEAMQAWGGVWMLGAALQDQEMLEAGIFGYTLESRATAEYWFDRKRRNIDYTKYHHPYCCNLTMQGVGWWTWFSGDPVWMHSIQWLPTSPVLTNYLSEDLAFARYDYTEMYNGKEVGDYEAATGGLGDESGLGNVCLSYLSLFDADSAARVWDRMDQMGKALAKNPDTGGITYWLTHTHRSLGEKCFDIYANHPLACVYRDTLENRLTYAVYNVQTSSLSVHFFGAKDTTITVPHGLTLVCGKQSHTVPEIADVPEETSTDPLAWTLPYPNLALHKPVTASSEENAGCLAKFLTDGDVKTRWGSEHKDNEYVIVDLQQQCYIDHLVLRWETAYATEYEIALSDDNATWKKTTYNSSGGVERINLFARARYIRLTGLKRATAYGTSLYELEAYGRPVNGTAGNLFVMALAATDTVVAQGSSTTLSVIGYDALGNHVATNAQLEVTQGTATLQGAKLLCSDYGIVTVTAKQDEVVASLDIIVMETEQPDSAIVDPAEVTLPLGDKKLFVTSLVNQFGATIDTCHTTYRATQIGDKTLTFDCFDMPATALVHVLAFESVNLALNKPATASGAEGDHMAAKFAFDGDQTTRWGSRFQDNEWLAVDLGDCYKLTTVKLFWENAYATSFDIELSSDGENYNVVKSVTNAEGGVQTLDIRDNGTAREAQFVRITCKTK
ncbi:MAG: discoidin domain-containing protein, partial [Paludibacteraceae bacterium]|nr:discoidin domain-containing protein [Paludibacteraceae bacterium]